jgi:lysyl-tRNA synthetase class 2
LADDFAKNKKPASSSLMDVRLRKVQELEALGIPAFATGFVPSMSAETFKKEFTGSGEIDESIEPIRMAGRVMALRVLGKASFARVMDATSYFQVYFTRDTLGTEEYKIVKKLDVGDIVGVRGRPFRTRTGELSLLTDQLVILTKSLRPLPEKWHGLSDVETRYRQRYLDLIVNPPAREIVTARSKIITGIRDFLVRRDFLEVETPMMQPIPGGATARPFETFHHALNRELYLRIAPELYLKRLLVGGFEKVFEINRNFRNEGISTQHNPEFTMLEFYQAYRTYEDLMGLTQADCPRGAAAVRRPYRGTGRRSECGLHKSCANRFGGPKGCLSRQAADGSVRPACGRATVGTCLYSQIPGRGVPVGPS